VTELVGETLVGETLVGEPIVGEGTAEADWARWPGLAGLAPLDLAGAGCPLIVAPHPDDEVLGAGGLLARLGGELVAVTDGEASHPGSTVLAAGRLAGLRRAETAEALAALGRPGTVVHHLAQPDGAVDEPLLTGQLAELLRPGRWCVATWRGDGHPDHEAVGRAAAAACGATGARLVEYPVWAWHWSGPGDGRLPFDRARRLDLDDATQAAKRIAIDCFTTQVRPLGPDPADAAVLPPTVLARFTRAFEVYLT